MYLEHANITVASIDEATAFLAIAFPEFKIRGEGKTATTRWLHFGTQQSYIALQQNHQVTPAQDEIYKHDGINHLGFVVDDLAEVVSNLTKAGYQIDPNSSDHQYRKRAYFYDGNQIEWEFIEYLSDQDELRNQY
ncbi:MAG: VOC family protein [Oceanospirillaceae bacterium]